MARRCRCGRRGARRGWGAPAALPQMAPGPEPDYTSQEPLPGPAAALGTGDKTVFLGFIKAVTQGRAFLEPSAPVGVGFGTGWVMAPGLGSLGMGGWRPLELPEPAQTGCTPIAGGPTATAHPVQGKAGGPSVSDTSRGWETLAEANAEAWPQFLSFGCFCGLVESCECAGPCHHGRALGQEQRGRAGVWLDRGVWM